MKIPSQNYGLGLLTGFAWTIATIALISIASPAGLISMAEDVAGQGVSRYISFGIFGLVGGFATLIEVQRK